MVLPGVSEIQQCVELPLPFSPSVLYKVHSTTYRFLASSIRVVVSNAKASFVEVLSFGR